MKLLQTSLLLLCLSSITCFSQKEAKIDILVTDFEKVPVQGERILFEGQTSALVYKGVSNEQGLFSVLIPAGDIYLIKIKSFGEDQDYNKISIPPVEEGHTAPEYELTIQIRPAKVMTLDDVQFDFGKSTLKKSSLTELNNLLEYLQLKPAIKVEIAGHTDNVGEDKANMTLSEKRANAVRDFLLAKKIPAFRVVAKGYGETQPIDTNDTEEGRKNNRRTEVRVLD